MSLGKFLYSNLFEGVKHQLLKSFIKSKQSCIPSNYENWNRKDFEKLKEQIIKEQFDAENYVIDIRRCYEDLLAIQDQIKFKTGGDQ